MMGTLIGFCMCGILIVASEMEQLREKFKPHRHAMNASGYVKTLQESA